MNQILTKLLSIKAHIGTKNWNKASAPFLLGFRKSPRIDKYAIFNLEKTIIALNQVLHFFKKLNDSSKLTPIHILIINTESSSTSAKQGSLQLNLSRISTISGEFSKKNPIISFTQEKWVGGTLTNWKQVQESILIYSQFKNRFNTFLKKHKIQFPIYQKYDKRYQGLMEFVVQLPDVIIMINPENNEIALKEAHILKIPVIAFTNNEIHSKIFQYIDYPIPGNNKSPSFVYFCLNLFTTLFRREATVSPR